MAYMNQNKVGRLYERIMGLILHVLLFMLISHSYMFLYLIGLILYIYLILYVFFLLALNFVFSKIKMFEHLFIVFVIKQLLGNLTSEISIFIQPS